MKYAYGLVLCAIGAVGAGGYYLFTTSGWLLGSEREIIVHVMRVRPRVEPVRLRIGGKLAQFKEVDVMSRLAGKVAEMPFKVGDRVRAGSIVAIIQSNTLADRSAELETTLRRAQDELAAKQEQVDNAEKQLTRARELHGQDLIARRDVEIAASVAEMARVQAEMSRAHLAQQEAMLNQVRTLQRFTRVTTPLSGVILRRSVEPGASIAESSVILTVADMDSLSMTASVPAAYSAQLAVGLSTAIVDPAAPDTILDGKIVHAGPPTKEGHQVVIIGIRPSAGIAQLRSGAAVEVTIITSKQEEATWVPRAVVVFEKGRNYVYKVASGRALRQQVAVGAGQDDEVKIDRGLKNGDLLIADNLNRLKPGRRVRAVDAP
ncbi:MAG TPA: efflux RND transporter periplasmic adaptor subunit [Candidatus Binatia bacterium]